MPPLTAVAVKTTLAPVHIPVPTLEVILTEGTTALFTVIEMPLLETDSGKEHPALLVIKHSFKQFAYQQ